MKWLSIAHNVSVPTTSTVSDAIFWVLQLMHTGFAFDCSSFCLCPKFDCLTLTQTQDEVLVKLSSCGGKVKVQLLANQAAVAQVTVDVTSLVVVDPLTQLNPKVPMLFGRVNLRNLLVQEEAKRLDAAMTRLQHTNRVKSQEQTLRNNIAV